MNCFLLIFKIFIWPMRLHGLAKSSACIFLPCLIVSAVQSCDKSQVLLGIVLKEEFCYTWTLLRLKENIIICWNPVTFQWCSSHSVIYFCTLDTGILLSSHIVWVSLESHTSIPFLSKIFTSSKPCCKRPAHSTDVKLQNYHLDLTTNIKKNCTHSFLV